MHTKDAIITHTGTFQVIKISHYAFSDIKKDTL